MPLYEFVCEKCGNEFTQLCNSSIKELVCEKCGKTAHKVLSKSNWVMNTDCSNPLPPVEHKTKAEKQLESRVLMDFHCPNCGVTEELFVYPSEVHTQECNICGSFMENNTLCTRYELKYNPKTDICDWSGNTSQYWSKVKEERRKGKQVKGLGEE